MRKLSECRFNKAKPIIAYCSNCHEFFVYDLWPMVSTQCPNADCYYSLGTYSAESFQKMLDRVNVKSVRVSPDGRCFADDNPPANPQTETKPMNPGKIPCFGCGHNFKEKDLRQCPYCSAGFCIVCLVDHLCAGKLNTIAHAKESKKP